MKAILVILTLCLCSCQSATPNWGVIAFVLGDTIDAPKKTNNEQPHPLE